MGLEPATFGAASGWSVLKGRSERGSGGYGDAPTGPDCSTVAVWPARRWRLKAKRHELIQSLPAHSSITQTMDTYAHLMEGVGGNTVRSLDEVFG
jgi:hypothetical protein